MAEQEYVLRCTSPDYSVLCCTDESDELHLFKTFEEAKEVKDHLESIYEDYDYEIFKLAPVED